MKVMQVIKDRRLISCLILNRFGIGEQKEDKNNNTSKPWTTLVAVKCPNYQWFANVYHVLPMITHEMSHNFRYLSQKKRNEFVFRFIVAFLSKYMMEKILEESEIDCRKIHYGNRERFFLKHIRAVINEELSEFVEQYSDSMKLQDLGVYLGKEFLKITGLHEYLYQEYHTASLIYEDLLHLFQLTKTGYIRPEDFEDDFWNCKEAKLKGSELFFNILLDLLHPKKGESMYEEWDAAIKKVDGTQVRESRKNLYQSIKGMLKSYNEGGIPYAYILRIPLKHLEIWERNDEQLCDLEKNDKNINHIMEALKQRKISRAQKLLNDREEKLTGEKFMEKSMNIGDQLSQIIGIYYPYRNDNYVKYVRSQKYYGRYMDDWYIMNPSRETLLDILEHIRGQALEFGIHINEKKTRIVKVSSTYKYLQIKYTLTSDGKIIKRINSKRVTAMRRKLKKLSDKVDCGEVLYENVENMFKGWMGSFYKLLSRQQRLNLISLYEELFDKKITIVNKKMIICGGETDGRPN